MSQSIDRQRFIAKKLAHVVVGLASLKAIRQARLETRVRVSTIHKCPHPQGNLSSVLKAFQLIEAHPDYQGQSPLLKLI